MRAVQAHLPARAAEHGQRRRGVARGYLVLGEPAQRIPGRGRRAGTPGGQREPPQQQALQAKQAALPPGSAVLTADLESASATVSGIQRQAQELHQRYLAAAAKTAADIDDHSGLWDRTEPVRTVLEAVLAPLDIVAADHWVSALEKVAGVPAEWVKEARQRRSRRSEALRTAGKSAGRGADRRRRSSPNRPAASSTPGTRSRPGWLKTAAGSIAEIRGLSYTLSGLGFARRCWEPSSRRRTKARWAGPTAVRRD